MAWSSLNKPTEEGGRIIALLDSKIEENILYADYSKVVAKVALLDDEEKASVLALCVPDLTGPQSSKNEAVRIAAVRVIVALLPLSLGAIADLLSRFQNKHNYEVHFTLFCYLDWAQEMPDASVLTRMVLPIVEKYLLTVPRKTARAAWMAGNMLGEHWNEQEALLLLTRAAHGARYSVGRQLSILGLGEMLERTPMGSQTHKDILKILRKISLSDPSRYVKEDAKMLLRHWRKLKEVDSVPPNNGVG